MSRARPRGIDGRSHAQWPSSRESSGLCSVNIAIMCSAGPLRHLPLGQKGPPERAAPRLRDATIAPAGESRSTSCDILHYGQVAPRCVDACQKDRHCNRPLYLRGRLWAGRAWPQGEILARSGRRVKRASPVRRDLLAHQDRRALRARKVLLGRLPLRRHLRLTAPSALRAPTARPPPAERSATKTRCLSSHTVARAEVL